VLRKIFIATFHRRREEGREGGEEREERERGRGEGRENISK
jgi:hypothetical protein